MQTFLEAKRAHFIANLVLCLLGMPFSTACSGSGGEGPVSTPAGNTQASAETPTSEAEDYRTLILADWELPPGDEQYVCAWVTVKEEMYVRTFRALNPPGTHHTVLSVSDVALQPDGVAPCDVTTVGRYSIYGTGVGTQPLESPPGIAVKLSPGNQLVLNLHLFNTSDQTLRGTSGTQTKLTPASQVSALAEGVAAGPLQLTVPPGHATVNGTCTFDHESTIFRLIPHMHETGVHMKVVAHSSIAGSVLLHDGDYDFNEQLVYPIDMVPMKRGDVVDVTCTYDNDTGHTLTFGESTKDEMCIAGIARFPAGTGTSLCTH